MTIKKAIIVSGANETVVEKLVRRGLLIIFTKNSMSCSSKGPNGEIALICFDSLEDPKLGFDAIANLIDKERGKTIQFKIGDIFSKAANMGSIVLLKVDDIIPQEITTNPFIKVELVL